MYEYAAGRNEDNSPKAWVVGVPARDLSDQEWEALSEQQQKEAEPLYRYTPGEPPVAEPVLAEVADVASIDGVESHASGSD